LAAAAIAALALFASRESRLLSHFLYGRGQF
jgi:hypothetical protein